MKKNIFNYLFCLICIATQAQTNLDINLNFHPGISSQEAREIDIEIEILLDDETVSTVNMNSFPASFAKTLSNPQNKNIYFNVNVLAPKNWAVKKNPIKYSGYNNQITLRKLDNIYIQYRDQANNSLNKLSRIAIYDKLISDTLYSTDNQKLEIYRNKAAVFDSLGKKGESLETYLSIAKQVDSMVISDSKKRVLSNELFNALLKAGNYNNLKQPKVDFPKNLLLDKNEVDVSNWKVFVELYNELYPNPIFESTSDQLKSQPVLIEKQFSIIGSKYNTF